MITHATRLLISLRILPVFLTLFLSLMLTSVAQASPVVVIGADGMTFDIIKPMVKNGKLPHFAKLLENGSHTILHSEDPMRSPAIWTTIATGQSRQKHGIYDFVTGSSYWPKAQRNVAQTLVTSEMRAVPAVWNIATDYQQKSVVVGWLNSWPAEQIKGVMVAPYVALGQRQQTSIKGKIYKDMGGSSFPKSAFKRLQPSIVKANEITSKEIAELLAIPPVHSPLWTDIPLLKRYLYTVRWSLASTRSNSAILINELKRSPDTALAMTYFDGSDTLAHRFWLFRQPLPEIRARLVAHGLSPKLAEELKRRFGHVLEGYYKVVDRELGKIMAAAGPDANIIVVSDHGWGDLTNKHGTHHAPHDHVPFDGEHRRSGIFIAAGPQITAHRESKNHTKANIYDIAPTTLRLMGISPPSSFTGKVLNSLLNMKTLPPIQNPPKNPNPHLKPSRSRASRASRAYAASVKTTQKVQQKEKLVYSTKKREPTKKPELSPFAEQELERLRSLGYVQ